jgi:hypothetical protein
MPTGSVFGFGGGVYIEHPRISSLRYIGTSLSSESLALALSGFALRYLEMAMSCMWDMALPGSGISSEGSSGSFSKVPLSVYNLTAAATAGVIVKRTIAWTLVVLLTLEDACC